MATAYVNTKGRALCAIYVVVLVCSVAFPLPAIGQSSDAGSIAGPGEEETRSGIPAYGLPAEVLRILATAQSHMIHMRLGQAEDVLSPLLGSSGDAANLARHQLMTVSVLRVVFNDRDRDYDSFFERSDALRDRVPEDQGNALASWIRADNELQRSWVWAKKGDYLRAALAGNSAWVGFDATISRHPTMYEAYLGLGALHVGLGALPRNYRRFLKILGYSGTLDEGIRELTLAADSSTWMRIQARFYLATLDLYGYPSSVEAVTELEALHKDAPDSPLFALLLGDAYLRENRAGDAARVLEAAQAPNHAPGVETVEYLDFFHAEALFRMGRCDDASVLLERYLQRQEGPALKARANLTMGLCLELAGNRDEAIAYYDRVVAAREFDEDAAASRRAERLSRQPMKGPERTLLQADRAFQRSEPQEAEGLYRSVFYDREASAAQKGAAAYGLGRSFHVRKEFPEALQWYATAIRTPGDAKAKWAPWGLFHSAEIMDEQGQQAAAAALLDRLLDYPETYDFRPTLENRAMVWRDRMK